MCVQWVHWVCSRRYTVPVTGASISIIVFSDLSRVAPSCMIRKAADSSIRPSSIKCCLSTSDWGLPVRASNTSATVNLWLGGKGTPAFGVFVWFVCLFVMTNLNETGKWKRKRKLINKMDSEEIQQRRNE